MRSATREAIGKDPAYKAWIASLPCAICALLAGLVEKNHGIYFIDQKSKTEVAHVGDRGLSQKCDDSETIPLCMEHHREGRYSHHKLGKGFFAYWKLDRGELVRTLNEQYERSGGAARSQFD